MTREEVIALAESLPNDEADLFMEAMHRLDHEQLSPGVISGTPHFASAL